MAKPKSRRINRSGRKSLKKNRSRKSRSRKNRNNKRVGGDPFVMHHKAEAFYNNIGSKLGIPVMGICNRSRKLAVKRAVDYYESLNNKDKIEMDIKITSCDEKGKQSQPQTINYNNMISIYDEYNKIINEENEAVKNSFHYNILLPNEDKNDVFQKKKNFVPN
jgi:phage-related tail protein